MNSPPLPPSTARRCTAWGGAPQTFTALTWKICFDQRHNLGDTAWLPASCRCGRNPGPRRDFSEDRDRRPLLHRGAILSAEPGRPAAGTRGPASPGGLPRPGRVAPLRPGKAGPPPTAGRCPDPGTAKAAVGIAADDPQAGLGQGLPHPVLVSERYKDRQFVQGSRPVSARTSRSVSSRARAR